MKYKIVHTVNRSETRIVKQDEWVQTLFDVYESTLRQFLWFKWTKWKLKGGYAKDGLVITESDAYFECIEDVRHYLFTEMGMSSKNQYIFWSGPSY